MALETPLDVVAEDTESQGAALPQRVFGKTGERVPILGLGTGPSGMGLQNEDAIRLYHRALDLGVTYLDTAPGYQRAQMQLGEVMKDRRDEAFLVTKTNAADGKRAREILEENLRTLKTDHVDLTYVHTVGNLDVDAVLATDGSLAALQDAREEGLTKYIGFTAHNGPWKAAKILEEREVDALMVAVNPGERHTYNFEEEVLPLAVAQNAAVAAMKVYGGARNMKYETPVHSAMAEHGSVDHESAFRYVLGLPGVAVAVIGMFSEAELLQNIAWAKRWTPLTPTEERALEAVGKQLAADWGSHFGPVRGSTK